MPRASNRSTRAAVSGSVGTLKGSFARISTRSARPGTSTPSQNESVPSRIPEPASRKRRSRWSRWPSPCTNRGHRPPTESRTASAARRNAAWLVNSTNMPPSDAWASSTSTRATAAPWPDSSSRGSGRSVGIPNKPRGGEREGGGGNPPPLRPRGRGADPGPLLEIAEVPARREGGAGEDHRLDPVEQVLLENRRQVERYRGEGDVRGLPPAPLEPPHRGGTGGRRPPRRRGAPRPPGRAPRHAAPPPPPPRRR